MNHPELVDDELLDKVLNQEPPSGKVYRTSITVLEACGNTIEWHDHIGDDELSSILSTIPSCANSKQSGGKAMRVIFIQNEYKAEALQAVTLPPITKKILREGGLSGPLMCELASPDLKWDKMGDSRFVSNHPDQTLKSFEISYRQQAGWGNQIGANALLPFTQFTRTENLSTYFCINYPPRAFQRLKRHAKEDPLLLSREFFIDALAADECLRAWKSTIGATRDVLIRFELQIDEKHIHSDTLALHRLSKTWHMLAQDISDLLAQLHFLQKSYGEYMALLQDPRNDWAVDLSSNAKESFEALESRCHVYARWILNYRDRTNIRINLLFHLSNQIEARTQREIAALSARIAEQTQRDSSSMITIAAVTMLFLPGTFVSAILSTTFFDYGRDGLAVSGQWWILPAATFPLMVLVFGVWLAWQRRLVGKGEVVMREREKMA
ncbi:hypothetical protein FKW77_008635 [Venturia effusa]|uniref:Uncharacterized protein n=1 Tax=Venturia effusa TaxID=50376 RepID=A0A517LEE1_9PEZI|nr:hypothetical protein FKW77_008635 [Venturia effusa]